MDETQTPNQPVDTRLSSITIEEEMSSSYIDYSMSVIVGRSLPDARDGLKPVHRRVLYTMYKMNNVYNRPYMKSARVVGEVMGKYHPHGDSSIYDTLVRLAQPFSLRYPLVDGQGNFGSVDGDPPAAMRYTEARMQRLADSMLDDIDKNTVDHQPTYDEKEMEPKVLPARLPNLLLNGSSGIAVGMATNIPPHNLGEVCDGLIHMIDHPGCSIDDLMQFVKGPDFPTGATICGTRSIEAMYKLGRGRIVVRGKAEIVENKGREAIIITEIPYMVNKALMIETMARLVNDKVLEGISDIRDESSEDDGMRVVIELKRNAFAQVVLNSLYKHTQLQNTFGANMLALDHGRPRLMTLKDFMLCYLDHRFEVLTRRTKFELTKAEERKHIVDGLLLALDNLDEVVRIIRQASNREEAKNNLMIRFGFSDPQVEAILNMRLYQLTGLERGKLEAELAELLARIDYLLGLLAHPERIYAIIKQDLIDLKTYYHEKDGGRRTEIVPMEGEVNIEDLIADEPCVITLSHRGYIKRVALSVYREQKRGGKGVTGVQIKEEDFIDQVFVAETHDTLLFFTNTGRLFAERAFEIPEAPRTSFGRPVINILNLQADEKVVALLPIRAFTDDRDILFATEKGIVKKTMLSAYRNVNRNGIIAITIEEGDRLIQVRLTADEDEIILATTDGQCIRFAAEQVRRVGRGAMGVKGITLEPGNTVCSFAIVEPGANLLLTTENGYGKRTAFEEFRCQNRGGKGIIGIDASERNGRVVAVHTVKDDDSMVMITSTGMMVRSPVADVRIIGRNTQGVRLLRLDGDSRLVSVSIAGREDEEPAPEQPSLAAGAPEAETDPAPAPQTEPEA